MFDIVIPVGPNDYSVITQHLDYTRRNIVGYRNIYVVTPNIQKEYAGCIVIDESIFPFNLESIGSIHGKNARNGWYLQQLIKLYAGFVIPDILDKYLVIDSDTFFTKPTTFVSNGKCLYNYGSEYHIPYFIHMQKLHPTLTRKIVSKSGICHHMIFEKKYLQELFRIVEDHHKNTEPFWKLFLTCVNSTDYLQSGASEYEIYFNFMLHYHPDDIIIRGLKWCNTNTLADLQANYDYISYHWYRR